HRSVAASLDSLAELYISQNNLPEAEQLLARAMGIRQRTLGEDHPDNAKSFDNLAQLHLARNDPVSARASLEQALEIRRTALGPNHLLVAESFTNIADLSWSQSDYADAITQLTTARGIRRTIMGADHPDVVRDGKDIAELERLQQVASQPQAPAAALKFTFTDIPDGHSPASMPVAEMASADTVEKTAPKAASAITAPAITAPAITASPITTFAASPLAPGVAPAPTQMAAKHDPKVKDGPALQLAAFKSPDTAKAEWARIQGNFPQLLAHQELNLQRIDLGDRGIFYRVRTGPFASLATAKAACTVMHDNKQDCLVIAR
ncbi:MAG: tetratricopeptide repeat protein, partial [Alphaproteobacteria bacterium]